MTGPSAAERDMVASACRNAEIELQELDARLSEAFGQLSGAVPMSAAVGAALAQVQLRKAQAALQRVADILYVTPGA